MQTTLGRKDRWRFSSQRIRVYAVVTGLHLGLLMFLLSDPLASRPASTRRVVSARDAIRIRFVRRHQPASMPPVPAPPVLATPRASVSDALSPRTLPTRKRLTPSTNQRPEPVEATAVPASSPPTYIAGGGRFNGASMGARSSNIHLPGSSQPIVKGLHMVDPRWQGIGGAVRTLQSVFGVPDPHCVDVDVWRGMSVRDLLDRHMSPDAVEKTAEAYRCGPPR